MSKELDESLEESQTKPPARVIGAFTAIMIVVASMIGTGVFTTTGILLEQTPSAAAVLWAWLIGGVIAFFGALSYAELVSIYPKNGGEFQLLTKIFHPSVGFVAGWVSLIVGFSAPIAAAAIAFGAYLQAIFPNINATVCAISIIVLLSLAHAVKVTFGSALQNVFTIAKLIIVVIFIIGGLYLGDSNLIFSESPSSTWKHMIAPSFAVGLIYITYAYSGWNGSAYIAGEIRNPRRSVPLALALGTAIVTLVYIGLNVVFLSAAPVVELSGQVDVGAVAAKALFGQNAGRVLSGVISLLLVSSISAMIMAGPRVYQSMGTQYSSFRFLSKRKNGSGPYFAILLQAVISLLMLATASFDALLSYIGFTLSISAALTVIGVFVLRKRAPHADRPYKCWGYPLTPLIFIALSLWMVIFTVLEAPIVALWGLITVSVGLILYYLAKDSSDTSSST
ncbi:MAG: amino acid permease [Bradymonadales bacterium]